MRTNIVIDDQLMADVMASGAYKTKREAVEAGLRTLQRRRAYAAIRAARGTLHWDDSDAAWARHRAEHAAPGDADRPPVTAHVDCADAVVIASEHAAVFDTPAPAQNAHPKTQP